MSEFRPLHYCCSEFFSHERRLVCKVIFSFYGCMLVKYSWNSIGKFYQLCVIIINTQQFIVQFSLKWTGSAAFIVSVLNDFWFLLLLKSFQNCNYHFVKIWDTCFHRHSALRTFWTVCLKANRCKMDYQGF